MVDEGEDGLIEQLLVSTSLDILIVPIVAQQLQIPVVQSAVHISNLSWGTFSKHWPEHVHRPHLVDLVLPISI